MDSKDLTIVIVTFKSESKIIKCLNSIKDNVRVIVVENSNNKKFKNYLESKFQNVRCILTKENKGYSVANNIGLKQVSTKYALVLNPDTILDNNAIRNFLLSAEKNQEFWLMGPVNAQMKNIEFKDNLAEVENIKGFAIFFNLLKFNKIFFDENFFLYFEEIDLCKRVRNKKGKIFLDKTIYINHQGACSVETDYKLELEKTEIGTGCGQHFTITKNIKVFSIHW